MSTTICDVCGSALQSGDWPFCGTNGTHERAGTVQVIDDTIPGGARWMHNLGDQPMFVEKKSELRQIMAERGLVFAEHNSYNKSDKSPYATRTRLRPGQIDPFITGVPKR
jgi:hypothetical protein